MELTSMVDKPILTRLADTATEPFSKEQLEELYMLIDDDVFERVSKRSNVDIFADEDDEDTYLSNKHQQPKAGLLSQSCGLALGVASENSQTVRKKEHNGRCDGDCAHCPPHYGYRYGRWYYGHHHQHGCEFGGNKGDGSAETNQKNARKQP
jgi:hypothetical protein